MSARDEAKRVGHFTTNAWSSSFDQAGIARRFLLFEARTAPGGCAMNDPKLHDQFVEDDEPRHSHDMLETAREIRVSPEEQEEAVEREEERRREQAAKALHEQAVAAYEAAVAGRQRAQRWLSMQALAFGVGNTALFSIDHVTDGGGWYRFPLVGWSVLLAAHAAWFFTRARPTPKAATAPLPTCAS